MDSDSKSTTQNLIKKKDNKKEGSTYEDNNDFDEESKDEVGHQGKAEIQDAIQQSETVSKTAPLKSYGRGSRWNKGYVTRH